MPSPTPHLDRLLARARRRMILGRLATRMATATAAAAGLTAVIALTLLLRGQPSIFPVLLTLTAGPVVGVIWGLWHCPAPAATAGLLDRRLGLRDLLATAVELKIAGPSDAFTRLVLADAEARSAAVAPAALDHLNPTHPARRWAVAAVLALGAILLALVGRNPLVAAAFAPENASAEVGQTELAASANPAPQPLRGSGADEEPSGPSSSRAADPTSDPSETLVPESPTDPPAGPSNASTGAGGGRSAAAGAQSRPHDPAGIAMSNRAVERPDPAESTTPTGGGAGGTSNEASAIGPQPVGRAGRPKVPAAPAPPWQSAGWPAARAAALRQVAAGRFDPAARDLVRDYFGRD